MEGLRNLQIDHHKPAGKPAESQNTLNSFNYFCVFCMRLTLFDNKGNFSACQECGIFGSNFGANCNSPDCTRQNQYIYWRPDFEKDRGDTPASAVCSKCTGATLWSNKEAPQMQANCRYCLKDVEMRDHGVL